MGRTKTGIGKRDVMQRQMQRRIDQKQKNRAGMKASALILFRVVTLIVSNISLNVALYYIGQQVHWSSTSYILVSAAVGALTVLVAIVLFCPAAFRDAWQHNGKR